MDRVLNVAAYRFVAIDDVDALRAQLQQRAEAAGLKGTVLVAPEGINVFLAGDATAVRGFMAALAADPRFSGIEVKESFSDDVPFGRLRVKKKREIVPLGDHNFDVAGLDPLHEAAPRIDAATLAAWLDEGRDVLLLDTRNRFEVAVGTFRGATQVDIDHFRDFPDAVRQRLDAWRDRTIITFCTGGIRCEKAAPLMRKLGFSDVHQLDGGILRWFETMGSRHWRGDCFVFDDRGALGADLQPASGAGVTAAAPPQAAS